MCALCLQSYHPKYFRQHKCINSESQDIYNIPQQRQQENIQNSHSDDPSCSPAADDDDDDERGGSDDNVIQQDQEEYVSEDSIEEDFVSNAEFEEILQEFDVDTHVGETTESSSLITWITLFLAFWQYTFGITDIALDALIRFFYAFLNALASRYEVIRVIAAAMPSSLYRFQQTMFPASSCSFIKHVVCIKCFSLYDLEDCHEVIGGIR